MEFLRVTIIVIIEVSTSFYLLQVSNLSFRTKSGGNCCQDTPFGRLVLAVALTEC